MSDTRNLQLTPEYLGLISTHQAAIYGYVLALHPHRAGAQDILQETNLVLWQKAADFTPGTNFKAWAFRIAYLQTLAHLKREARARRAVFDEELLPLLAADALAQGDGFEERHLALRNCLEALPATDLAILQAHYSDNHPLATLAERLGRSVGALKQVLLRLRRSLRRCIEVQTRQEMESHGLPHPQPQPKGT